MLNKLILLADQLDAKELHKEANLVDAIIVRALQPKEEIDVKPEVAGLKKKFLMLKSFFGKLHEDDAEVPQKAVDLQKKIKEFLLAAQANKWKATKSDLDGINTTYAELQKTFRADLR